MKRVTMLELSRDAESVLRRVARGERFVLSHRGKPDARLERVDGPSNGAPRSDPFLTIGRRAIPSPKGQTKHRDLDRILYGNR